MAGQLVDSLSSDQPSLTSILNKLPTKRIDARIEAAAEARIPEKGQQTGGYDSAYSNLAHLHSSHYTRKHTRTH
jgi:hypothetical protein